MKIIEHNVTTGEIIERTATKDELVQNKIDEDNRAEQMAKIEADAIAKAALLERLGISADEARLLLS